MCVVELRHRGKTKEYIVCHTEAEARKVASVWTDYRFGFSIVHHMGNMRLAIYRGNLLERVVDPAEYAAMEDAGEISADLFVVPIRGTKIYDSYEVALRA